MRTSDGPTDGTGHSAERACFQVHAGRARTHREVKEGLDVKVVRGKDEVEEGLVVDLHKILVPHLCARGRSVGRKPASRGNATQAHRCHGRTRPCPPILRSGRLTTERPHELSRERPQLLALLDDVAALALLSV